MLVDPRQRISRSPCSQTGSPRWSHGGRDQCECRAARMSASRVNHQGTRWGAGVSGALGLGWCHSSWKYKHEFLIDIENLTLHIFINKFESTDMVSCIYGYHKNVEQNINWLGRYCYTILLAGFTCKEDIVIQFCWLDSRARKISLYNFVDWIHVKGRYRYTILLTGFMCKEDIVIQFCWLDLCVRKISLYNFVDWIHV